MSRAEGGRYAEEATDEGLLPPDVLQAIRRNWEGFAEEARAAAGFLAAQADGYHGISRGKTWNKLELYNLQTGWNEELCAKLTPRICSLFRGRMKTEQEQVADQKRGWGYIMSKS